MTQLEKALKKNEPASPTPEQDRIMKIGTALATTAYELNNGYRIRDGQPLQFIDDSALINLPGSRSLNLSIPDGTNVVRTFNNPSTGVNAFLATNNATGEIYIGIAGTNGVGSDAPDTKEDVLNLGLQHARELFGNQNFIDALGKTVNSLGGISKLNGIIMGGQSLAGATAPLLGMMLVHGDPKIEDSIKALKDLGITAEKIKVVSVNGMGFEYAAKHAGFTMAQVDQFTSAAQMNRLVVYNQITGQFDLVSQLGGKFYGNNWILEVEEALTVAQLHKNEYGVAEGVGRVGGDLTRLRSGTVPTLNHETVSKNLYLLGQTIPIENNTVSLTWAGYVALLLAAPGEGTAALSLGLQQFAGMPKPVADVLGAVSEMILRALPVTHAAQAMQFIFGGYLVGRAIGSSESARPFDLDSSFGPVSQGWQRKIEWPADRSLPPIVIDFNPFSGIQVVKQVDGRTLELHPDGTRVESHPEHGIAILQADGSGMLFLRGTNPVDGDIGSSTVFIHQGTSLELKEDGWHTIRPLDLGAGWFESTVYAGHSATTREIQFEVTAQGTLSKKHQVSAPITRTLPSDDITLPETTGLTQFVIPLGPNHVQFVVRDEDRRTVQTVDVVSSEYQTETTYKDGLGNLQKIIKVEQINGDATRTTLHGEGGSPVESTVVQRFRQNGQLYDLEDHTDFQENVRILTVRDSQGFITRAEAVPLNETPAAYAEIMQEQLHSDVADFLTALRQKDTAGVILSTARIALDYARAQGAVTRGYEGFVDDMSSGLALIQSLRSLQSGDTLAKIGGTVGLLNSTNYFAGQFNAAYLSKAQTAALAQIGAILSIANLKNLDEMLEAGQIGSAGASVISAINGVGYLTGTSSALMGAGAIVALNPIVLVIGAFAFDSLFGEDPPPPPPQGIATFYRDDEGMLRYRFSESNRLGEKILSKELDLLLPKLEQQIAEANGYMEDERHLLSLVASRMPAVRISAWPSSEGNGVDNYFFVLEQQNPLQEEPGLLGISRLDLVKLYAETLLLPEAIVQQWEVDHLRAKFGNDEALWLTEGAWLRRRSPIEQKRAQLQVDADRTKGFWEEASTGVFRVVDEMIGSKWRGNLAMAEGGGSIRESARQFMEAAQAALDAFNVAHPVDPGAASRATPEQEATFASKRAAAETVALQWRRVLAVDLGNDSIQILDLPGNVGTDLESLRTQRVARIDVDGDGFKEATQWIAPSDAVLGIDRSGNHQIDDGSELFHGADTPFDQHGLASLGYYDANADGLITSEDPAYRQLRLWIDLDGDGSTGQLEVFDLQMRPVAWGESFPANPAMSSMAVKAIDLKSASMQFADGSSASIAQLDLLAHVEGIRLQMDEQTGNLNVLHEDGLRENFITLVDDMSALQELQSSSLSAPRRAELEALAVRYGLNPQSAEFSAIVRSLRATGESLGEQDAVIYFGNDDVWVDPALRERLAQLRISFRKLDGTSGITTGEQLARTGRPLGTEAVAGNHLFDDRWVPSRRVGKADIRSEDMPVVPAPQPSGERPAQTSDVYSLLAATKGAQSGGLVTQAPSVSSAPAQGPAPAAEATLLSSAQPTATLQPLHLTAREDDTLTFGYTQLAQEARLLLAATDPSLRLELIGLRSTRMGAASMDDDAGVLRFRPHEHHVGDAGFVYVLADQHGRVFEREVRFRLQPVNDAPLVAGEFIASSEDVPLLIDSLALLANDRDIEGDALRVTGIARAGLGRAELLGNGQIHYVPPSDQYGTTDTLDYIVQDSHGASSVARLRIALSPADDAPSVVSERLINAREDQVLRIPAHLLLRNDFDVDTDARLGAAKLKITAVGSAEHGSMRLDTGGDIVFAPDAHFHGDAGFSYTVIDATGMATTGRALVRIEAANDAPMAAGERIDSREDELLLIDPALLLANDIDADIDRGERQRLSVIGVDQAVGGTVELREGMIRFLPEANHSGSASFRYLVGDGAGGFVEARVEIALAAVNDAPSAPPVRFSALEDTELLLPARRLLEGATDVDGNTRAIRLVGVGSALGGSIALVDDQLRFRPSADFAGTASFVYTLADEHGAETTATASIDINNVNDAPVFMEGSRLERMGDEDREIRVAESALATMFWDADGDKLCIDPGSLVALTPGDSLHFDETRRELIFRGAPNDSGMRQIRFALTDGEAVSAPQTVALQLRPVNDAPVVNAVGFQMLEDGGATDPTQSAWSYLSHSLLLSGATDVDGDALQVVNVSSARTAGAANPQSVELLNDAAGQRVGIRAPLNYHGAIEFEFTVADGKGGETVQKAYGSVVAVNDSPHLNVLQTSAGRQQFGRSQMDVSSWALTAWDPDERKAIKVTTERNPMRGAVTLGGHSTSSDARGGLLASATISTKSGAGNRSTTETAWFSATDSAGAKSHISISFTGRYSSDPIVIDLGRDGLEFIDIANSRASFDVDGARRRSAWIGAQEGILAWDGDQDGNINRLDEIAFGTHVGQPALSDLQALQHADFDSNQDGMFDGSDPRWSQCLLWQDRNGNGASDDGELQSLHAAGIDALYLNANVLNRAEGADVRVRGYTRVRMNDGSLRQAADVWLGLESPENAGEDLPDPSMQQASLLGSDQFGSLLQQLANAPQEGNRAPMVYGYLPTQFADEGQPFRLELAPNFFIDADTEDRLRIDARLADDAELPAWLRWDSERLLLEGTPGASDAGPLQLAFTATDRDGARSHTSFTLMTTAANHAPTVAEPLALLPWLADEDYSYVLPGTLFSDPIGDPLMIDAGMADGSPLPLPLRFDPATRTLSGRLASADLAQPLTLLVTATDTGGLSATTTVQLAAAQFGSDADDLLTGTHGPEYLWADAGNDVLRGGGGNDTLVGGSGDDLLDGGSGDDLYQIAGNSGNDILSDGSGTDILSLLEIDDLREVSLGAEGFDLLLGFRHTGGNVTVKDFWTSDGQLNTAGSIDRLRFRPGHDISAAGLLGAMEASPLPAASPVSAAGVAA